MNADWTDALVGPDTAIWDVMESMTKTALQISLVVDKDKKLLGTVTDGDIRRAILNNADMRNTPAREIMNTSPRVASVKSTDEEKLHYMRDSHVRTLPVVDQQGRLISITQLTDLLDFDQQHDNPIILMAGGLGTRLRPFTNDVPKPLLPVGNKPLLETIIGNFVQQKFRNFVIAVNYKAGMIQDYFGTGTKWGASISYLHEQERMGTAGALRLLETVPDKPFIVMNGDLLTQVRFETLLDFHMQEGAVATMCVREYEFQVPFGVVDIDQKRIKSIDEKPIHNFFVNAGIYVLNPSVLSLIPECGLFDMTSLFERLIDNNEKALVFPIKEYWMDVGRVDDLERAEMEFQDVFDK